MIFPCIDSPVCRAVATFFLAVLLSFEKALQMRCLVAFKPLTNHMIYVKT